MVLSRLRHVRDLDKDTFNPIQEVGTPRNETPPAPEPATEEYVRGVHLKTHENFFRVFN